MTYTSIEQSKALMRLGLDEKTADLKYVYKECRVINGCISNDWVLEIGKINDQSVYNEMPCWSAESLLEMLPTILYGDDGYPSHSLIFQRYESNSYLVEYALNYGDNVTSINDFSEEGELLNTLVKAILWLLKNKYL